MKIFKVQIVFLIGLIVLYLNQIFSKDYGDTNTVVFSLILYIPYVLGLLFYNGLVIFIFSKINIKFKILNYLLPIFFILIYYFLINTKIVIRYWNLNLTEFVSIVSVLLISNLLGYFMFKNGSPKP